MITRLLSILLLLMVLALYGCYSVPKTYKERTLDDMYPILTYTEYQMLDSLNTDKEINMFLEKFWMKMDPTSGITGNRFRTEYLHRLEYANSHFPDTRGRGKSDRKRIYLIYGPPAYIDRQEFTNFKIGTFSGAKSVEIWLYATAGKNIAFPTKLDNIYFGEKKFIFGDMTGSGTYQLLYSSEDINDIDVRLYK